MVIHAHGVLLFVMLALLYELLVNNYLLPTDMWARWQEVKAFCFCAKKLRSLRYV